MQPLSALSGPFLTLATKNDRIWPNEIWPRMKLDSGFEIGSKGGHGPIRYYVSQYEKDKLIEFTFTYPKEFVGIHKLELLEHNTESVLLRHTIDIKTSLIGGIKWIVGIKWLHDALIEDAFDKLENYFDNGQLQTKWNFWVRFLRFLIN